MRSDNREEVPQRRDKPDQPVTDANETVERDPVKVPVQPTDAEPRPEQRPDLDWVEHED